MLLWIESQPTSVIALIVFSAAYLTAALIFSLAALLSRHPIAKALQPVTPGLLSPLGTILGILIAFLAVRVWSNLDHAQEHTGREVTALRGVVMLANALPQDLTGPHSWDQGSLNLRCNLACCCPSRIKPLLAASAVGMWATRLRCPSEAAYPQPSPPPRFCPCRRATPPSASGCSSPGEGAENCRSSSRN